MRFKLLTEVEVAKRLRMPKRTISELRRTGQIAYLPGKPVRIDELDLLAYIERAFSEVTLEQRIGPPTAEEAAAAAQMAAEEARAEMIRLIKLNHYRREQAQALKARGV